MINDYKEIESLFIELDEFVTAKHTGASYRWRRHDEAWNQESNERY